MKIKIRIIDLPTFRGASKYFRFNIYKSKVLRQTFIEGVAVLYPVILRETYLRIFKLVIEIDFDRIIKK